MTGRLEHPGAGTLYVLDPHGAGGGAGPSGSGSGRGRKERTWDELARIREDTQQMLTPDVLLEKGIGEYTFVPGPSEGILGRGKFSVVYKVVGPDGQKYALKHTPLHPHHPLIAARLLREPTLLAQLPPHPSLIGVQGMIRTQGHFYLIEQYASRHVPLPAHPLPLAPSRAAYILDQLVSVIRDCLHRSRVCHRDLKGENILIDLESGDLLILDLGLATQFSASEPKLTTCCGSPAFHSPEIVNALAHPPGVITYYGPELDIWCIALTLLSLLLRIRFPLGPHHTHYSVMRSRTKDRLQELDELYPPEAPWRALAHEQDLTAAAKEHERSEWQRVRKAMKDFLEIDGQRRMQAFERYRIGTRLAERLDKFSQCLEDHGGRSMKSTSFIPTPVEYTLPLYLDPTPSEAEDSGQGDKRVLILDNPTGVKERKVLSYIRYLLRSGGIGYHCLTNETGSDDLIYQLVLALPPANPALAPMPPPRTPPQQPQQQPKPGWVASLNPFKRPSVARSVSLPAQKRPPAQSQNAVKSVTDPEDSQKTKSERWLRIWIKIEFEHSSPTSSTTASTDGHSHSLVGAHYLSPLVTSTHLPELSFNTIRRPSPRRKTTSDRYGSTRPSPLSRNASVDAQCHSRSATPTRGARPANRGRVLIRLSDERGYEVLRRALGVQHPPSQVRAQQESSDSESSPVVIHTPRVAGEDGEEERGRPRSKESGSATEASALLLSKAKQAGHVGVQVVKDDEAEEEGDGSGGGRAGHRRNGFLGLFTATTAESDRGQQGGARSVSVPPPQEPVVH